MTNKEIEQMSEFFEINSPDLLEGLTIDEFIDAVFSSLKSYFNETSAVEKTENSKQKSNLEIFDQNVEQTKFQYLDHQNDWLYFTKDIIYKLEENNEIE